MKKRWLVFVPLFVVGALAFGSSFALAHEEPEAAKPALEEQAYSVEERARAARLARQIMSPFCPGRTISDCTSEYAGEWRREILGMVAEGRTSESIVQEFEGRVGRNLSGIPDKKLSLGLPVFLSLSAGIVLLGVFSWLRRERRQPEVPEASSAESESVSDERLRAELSELDDE